MQRSNLVYYRNTDNRTFRPSHRREYIRFRIVFLKWFATNSCIDTRYSLSIKQRTDLGYHSTLIKVKGTVICTEYGKCNWVGLHRCDGSGGQCAGIPA